MKNYQQIIKEAYFISFENQFEQFNQIINDLVLAG